MKLTANTFLISTYAYWTATNQELAVPLWYVVLMGLFEFQNEICLTIKMLVFFPIFVIFKYLDRRRLENYR